MLFKYPSSFARFYDTIYHQLRDSVDNDFFIDEIKKTRGKTLEIGVGTGRLFIKALSAGSDTYGIDISESMLEVLYGKLPQDQHFRISKQNMTDFSSDDKYDLAIAPFRVFMHLTEKEDQLKALNNVWKHLNADGRFIFDVFVPDLNYILKGFDNQMDYEGEYEPGRKVRRFVTTYPDLIDQIIEVNFHLEWEEPEGIKHDYWKVPMRFFFRYELEHLIERSEFRRYEISGDYNMNRLNKDSREFVVICYKD
jgi:SAM-dependent methyltransferase